MSSEYGVEITLKENRTLFEYDSKDEMKPDGTYYEKKGSVVNGIQRRRKRLKVADDINRWGYKRT